MSFLASSPILDILSEPLSPQPSDSASTANNPYFSDSDSTMSDFFGSELHWPVHSLAPTTTSTKNDSPTMAKSMTMISAEASTDVFPTPPNSDNGRHTNDGTPSAKRRRNPIPENKKDDKYWERRKRNNLAAKRSRETKRMKQEESMDKAEHAITENTRLKSEVEVLKSEVSSLRRLLQDANATLAIWIKARQATEPLHQLPPPLRDTKAPLNFVSFPH